VGSNKSYRAGLNKPGLIQARINGSRLLVTYKVVRGVKLNFVVGPNC